MYLACSQWLDIPLRRDITLGSPQLIIVSISTELHQHLATTIKLRRHSPEVVRVLLTDSDVTLLEVNALHRASILSSLPLGHGLIVAVRLIVEELDSTFGREGIRLEGDLMRGVGHIPIGVINRSTYHRTIEMESQVVCIVPLLLRLRIFLGTELCRSEVHGEGVGLTGAVEGVRIRHDSTTRGIDTRDTDSTSDHDLSLGGINTIGSIDIDASFVD